LLCACDTEPPDWTESELDTLRSLWIGSLPPLPPDPGNAVADEVDAARLGKQLFFDTRLSANGSISCATCHQPERRFTDGLQKGQAIGSSRRNTLSIVGAAYSPWLYWDGRKDSLWSQALSPLEDPKEHGSSREHVVSVLVSDSTYRAHYRLLFGNSPEEDEIDRVFANVGKVIAAYERLLMPGASRFDRYVESVLSGAGENEAMLANDEIRGLRLFIGEAQCIQCHNGPLFTNHEFHNTGVLSFPGEVPDKGRVQGIREALADPFNCLGEFSDDPDHDCDELEFARSGPEVIGALRTPSLRNLEDTAPFMHKGQMATLREVLEHYDEAPSAMIGHNEAKPLGLSGRELDQLEAFLGTLAAKLATDEEWLRRPE
jgi:cytochrome c peroxidase